MKFALFGLQAIWCPSTNFYKSNTFFTAVSTQCSVNFVCRLANSQAGPHDQRPAGISSVCPDKCLIKMG